MTIKRKLFSAKPTHFLDLNIPKQSSSSQSSGDISLKISKSLPSYCRLIDASLLFTRQASALHMQSSDREAFLSVLQNAITAANKFFTAGSTSDEALNLDQVLQVDQLGQLVTDHRATSVVHWPVDGKVEVKLRPANSWKLFSIDKTYVLFGLSGQVGQSLCEWMVAEGAGCVCLTSRRP